MKLLKPERGAIFDTSSSSLTPLHQVLICGTHVLPQLRPVLKPFLSGTIRRRPLQGQHRWHEAEAIGAAGRRFTDSENEGGEA